LDFSRLDMAKNRQKFIYCPSCALGKK